MVSAVNGTSSGGVATTTQELDATSTVTGGTETKSTGAEGLNAQARSGFDDTNVASGAAADGTATADAKAAEPKPIRATDYPTTVGSPDTLKAADLVTKETKLDTIAQAALPEEREAVRAEFAAATDEVLDAAFNNVLKATQEAGTREVELGSHRGYVEVDAKGKVNGGALASDRELALAPNLVNLTTDERKAQLRQVGVTDDFFRWASESQVARAFTEVETRRQLGTPGDFTFVLEGQRPIHGGYVDQNTSLSFSVGADRTIGTVGGPKAAASSVGALAALKQRESVEWPSGKPEDRIRTRIEDVSLTVPAFEKLETLKQVVDPASAQKLTELFNAQPGLATDSIDAAYQSLLEARKSPGGKDFSFSLTPLREEVRVAESGDTVALVGMDPVSFSSHLDVTADGKVNGKQLEVDDIARYASEVSTLHAEVKADALKAAGLNESWIANATAEQIDFALGKLRLASTQPGVHELDFGYSHTTYATSESGGDTTFVEDGKLRFTTGADGTIDGKTPYVETALATQLVMERLPMGEKRMMLAQLGIPGDATRNISADDAADLLTRVAMKTQEPGDHTLYFQPGGEEWQLGLKVGDKGEILGAGASRVPPDPPFWKEIIGPVLTIVSFVFPVVAPICQVIQAGIAIANGAKGLGLIAAVAGAAAGFSGIGDMAAGLTTASSTTTMLSNVASLASAANGVVEGAKNGNFLGVFSSVVNLASASGNLAGAKLDSSFDTLVLAGRIADYADKIHQGDVGGLISNVFNDIKNSNTNKTDGTKPGGTNGTTGTDGGINGTWNERNDPPNPLGGWVPGQDARTAVDEEFQGAADQAGMTLRGVANGTDTGRDSTILYSPVKVDGGVPSDANIAAARTTLGELRTLENTALDKLSDGARANYEQIAASLKDDPIASLSLQQLLFEGRLQVGDSKGGSMLQTLTGLANGSTALAPGMDRGALTGELIRELAQPSAISQGDRNTCGPTTVGMMLASTNPSEYARLVVGLASPEGKVQMAGGTFERVPGTEAADGSARASTQRLVGPALMEYGNGDRTYNNALDLNTVLGLPVQPGAFPGMVARMVTGLTGKTVEDSGSVISAPSATAMNNMVALTGAGVPVPAMLMYSESGNDNIMVQHWVLATSVSSDHVTLMNPWGYEETMPRAEFDRRLKAVAYTDLTGTVQLQTPPVNTYPRYNEYTSDWPRT